MNASTIDQSSIVFIRSPYIRLLDSPAVSPDLGAAITSIGSHRLAEEVIARFNTERRFPELSLTAVRRSALSVQQRLTLDRQLSRLTDIAGGLGSDDYRTSSASAARLGRLQMYLDTLASELEPLVHEDEEFLRLSAFRGEHLKRHLEDAKSCATQVRQLRSCLREMQTYLDFQERAGCDIYGFNYRAGQDPKWDRLEARQDSLRDDAFAALPAICSWARCYNVDLTYCRRALGIQAMNLADREQQLWLMEEELCTLIASLEGRAHLALAPSASTSATSASAETSVQCDFSPTDGFTEPDRLTLEGTTYVVSPPDGLVGDAIRQVVAYQELRMADLFRGGCARIWDEALHEPSDPKQRRQVQKVRQLFTRLEVALRSAEPPLNIGFKVTKTHIERTIHSTNDRV